MNSAKPSKSTITTWLMSIPRKFWTVSIISAASPFSFPVSEKAPLIFSAPKPGISARVSRGIESLRNDVSEACRTMIVSARGEPAPSLPRSLRPVTPVRWSPPRMRMLEPASTGEPAVSASLASSESLPFWIWAETAKAMKLSRIQPPTPISTQRSQWRFSPSPLPKRSRRPPLRRCWRRPARSGLRRRSRRPGRDL